MTMHRNDDQWGSSPPPYASYSPEDTSGAEPTSEDDKTQGMLCHLLVFVGFVIPLGNVIGPLVIYLMKKGESAFVAHHGRAVLNFQITLSIVYVLLWVFMIANMFMSVTSQRLPIVVLLIIPLFLLIALGALVLTIIGAMKAKEGRTYRYPFAIGFL